MDRWVVEAIPHGERINLRLDGGSERCVDHTLLATGYRVDATQYGFLSPELLKSLQVVEDYPELEPGMESVTIPGLISSARPLPGCLVPSAALSPARPSPRGRSPAGFKVSRCRNL